MSATSSAQSRGTFAVAGGTPTAPGPADDLTLNLPDEAWQGRVEFVVYINGDAATTCAARPGRDSKRHPRRFRSVTRLQREA
jgi:hypothetical protein